MLRPAFFQGHPAGDHRSTSGGATKRSPEGLEPTSVLDNRRSPSPTLSSPFAGAGGSSSDTVAAVSDQWPTSFDPSKKEDWELQPIPDSVGVLGMDDWEAIFADSAVPGLMLETYNTSSGGGQKQQHLLSQLPLDSNRLVEPGFVFQPIEATICSSNGSRILAAPCSQAAAVSQSLPCVKAPAFSNPILSRPPPLPTPESLPPRIFYPGQQLVSPAAPQSNSLFIPTATAAAHHHHHHWQQQTLLDQILKAAELVEAGDFISARGILARLNHRPPSIGKPLLRSAFYFKEALNLLVEARPQLQHGLATPLDVLLKLGAYKAFSEVSPVLQFTSFTCTQALLEELRGSSRIHIIDFDIGVGGQWSSLMQELAHCRPDAVPMLKISAFISPGSHHPFELHLTIDTLSHFAADLCIPFEFSILSNPSELLCMSARSDEAIAVNLPVGAVYNPPTPTLLRLVKQLSPKIVVSIDHGCDRSDLPFSQHFFHALESCMILLDSIDAVGTSSDVANKIGQFLLQPRIQGAVLGRHRAGDGILPWRMLFSSAGFVPVHFSNVTEAQAEWLLKRVQVRGFHVEKRKSSLFLHWQHRELASVSAWRC